jgi:hypothetical protein
MDLVMGIWPDLTFAISFLAQFFSAPNKQYVVVVNPVSDISIDHGTLLRYFFMVVRFSLLDSVIPITITASTADDPFQVICLNSEI